MKSIQTLALACAYTLQFLKEQEDVADAQVFVSSNEHLLARFNYTSHILSNGVEEPKARQDFGMGLTVVFHDGRVGFGSTESSLSREGTTEAFSKARAAAVNDPDFCGLPRPEFGTRTLQNYHDPELMELPDADFVVLSWDILRTAFAEFEHQVADKNLSDVKDHLQFIVGGDIQLIRERMAIASFAMPDVQTDQSSMAITSITAMLEAKNAKGSGFFAGRTLLELKDKGPEAARTAVRSAIATISGERIESGEWTVIFGPQAVSELANNLIVPGLHASTIYSEDSPFMEKFLQEVASPLLSIYDDGANPNFMGAKGITCEGLPTGCTKLIEQGRFVGLLSNHYEFQRLMKSQESARRLGTDPKEYARAFWPRNGFRFSDGAGRSFAMDTGTSGSNTVITGTSTESPEMLIGKVKKGIYIGRMWYVYPINGLRAGDFTGTITADSYIIEDGKLFSPLKPNTVRINDNILKVLKNITGVSDRLKPVNLWGADEAMYAPDLLVSGVRLESIAEETLVKET